jgi:hypothetical protein
MKALRLFLLPILLGVAIAIAAVSGPIKGFYCGSGNSFTGTLSRLGLFTATYNPSTNTITLVAANGDKLYATVSNYQATTGSDGTIHYSENWTFVGGTGRFTNYTGGATVTGDQSTTGTYAATVAGTVTYPNGNGS